MWTDASPTAVVTVYTVCTIHFTHLVMWTDASPTAVLTVYTVCTIHFTHLVMLHYPLVVRRYGNDALFSVEHVHRESHALVIIDCLLQHALACISLAYGRHQNNILYLCHLELTFSLYWMARERHFIWYQRCASFVPAAFGSIWSEWRLFALCRSLCFNGNLHTNDIASHSIVSLGLKVIQICCSWWLILVRKQLMIAFIKRLVPTDALNITWVSHELH